MDMFWEKANWERTDKHFLGLEQAPFRRSFPNVRFSPGVSLIRGPRQIGKSTWLKTLLKIHSDKGASCFYYSCEDLQDHRDLAELIRSQPKVEFFFLDEITFVDEWWRAIKKATDASTRICFVLTGSNSYDLRKGLDLMPGRWSKHAGELWLLPMLFEEWCQMRDQAGWPRLSLVDGIQGFMRVGGFPVALAEAGPDSRAPIASMQTYLRWIMGDVIKLKRQEIFMKELLGQLAKTMGSSISLQKLAQKTQLMSYHTVQDYLSILEHAFALRTLYAYDPDTDSFRFKKEKKFYFTDPMVYWVALECSGQNPPEEAQQRLAEMIAAEWLFRKVKRLGYYASRTGEVDFISKKDWALEIKWAPIVHNLSKTYKNLVISNKKVWHQGNFFEPFF